MAWLPLLLQAQAVAEPPRRAPMAGAPPGAAAGAAAGAVAGVAWLPLEGPADASTSDGGLRGAPGAEEPAGADAQAERSAPGREIPTAGEAPKPGRCHREGPAQR